MIKFLARITSRLPALRYFSQTNIPFSSEHYAVTPSSISNYLSSKNMDYRVQGEHFVLKQCPLCHKPTYNKADNQYKLYISHEGVFICFRCQAKGNWFQFKSQLSGVMLPVVRNQVTNVQQVSVSLVSVYNKCEDLLRNDLYQKSREYLFDSKTGRGLSEEVVQKYRIGVGFEKFRNQLDQLMNFESIYFPLFAQVSEKEFKKRQAELDQLSERDKRAANYLLEHKPIQLVKMKSRAVGKENKSKQRFVPAGVQQSGLFGWNLVTPQDQTIVLTEGQFDAMAVHYSTGMLAVSLPNGANNLPVSLLPQLEQFKRIYLWMDADEAGVHGAKRFAEKLGINRTYIVNSRKTDLNGPKDANQALLRGYRLTDFIEEGKPLVEDDIIRFSDIKSQVLKRLIHKDEHVGIASGTFGWFNKKMKGLRRGQLTILTGPTGCGKTTFLSQYSLDFLMQGVPTLWGSFEVKNEILASHMLQQFMPRGAETPEQFERFASDFEELPLYFLKYFGSTQIDNIIASLEFAVYQYDIASIIIDNLQFLLSGQGRSSFDRFELQDYSIGRLRKFASENNIHLTLVIHPKKVDDDQELTVASVFGSAKATQEADNILIFQNKQKFRFLDIRKNRFDGDIGRVPLGFDRKSKRFFELTEQELALLVRESFPIRSIIERRLRQFNGMLSPKQEPSKTEKNDMIQIDKKAVFEEKYVKRTEQPRMQLQKPIQARPAEPSIQEEGSGLLQFQRQLSQFADQYLANKEKVENKTERAQDRELREMFEPVDQDSTEMLFTNPVWNDEINLITEFHTNESKEKLEKVLKYQKLRDERKAYIEQLQRQEEFIFDPNSFAKMGVPRKEVEALHQIVAADELEPPQEE